ncbi:hypothetical protein N7495_009313 [Penicillium taxi]|uniref:uncharacterized protein n=1 Tax=Penicillium taxi TaxID=168475 RepID=UPI00254569E0|nr:uncharacterized protein N7495_009313 [Penicillium taxi]KAJ5884803.1 hypothetical protein N7495_009313 [Penicillium taxi]
MSTEQDSPRPIVVRRFTSELKPDSDLAVQTKSYQEDLDMEMEMQGVEIARQTLQDKCNEFFKSVEQKEESEKKKLRIWGRFNQNDAEKQLVQEIGNSQGMTVNQVSSITNDLEEKWKKSNSKASVNYSTIAEQLSSYIADLSERIAICTSWLDLYTNIAMKERLSEIYEQYFDFFIEVACWYLKSKGSKILDSFNSKFTSTFQGTMNKVQRSIQLLDNQASIENARETKSLLPAITDSADLIIAQVLQSRKENNEVGRKMYEFLLQMGDRVDRIERAQLQAASGTIETISSEVLTIEATEFTETTTVPKVITRAEAEQLCQHLQILIDQVGGSDGIRLALQAGRLVAEPLIIRILGKWATATSGNDLILWVISPYEPGPQNSADLVAYGVIWSAIQAKAQFISYICQRPCPNKVPGFEGFEDKAAVLAMAYSLIWQLLQFQHPNDELILRRDMLDRITKSEERWSSSLELLSYLLEETSSLGYFIISGINLLEGGACEMCREFVDVVFSRVKNSKWPLRVLFTTPGQSRPLSETVSMESKVLSNKTFHQTKGRMHNRNIQMSG